jgi:uncharacterized RDD family membrane protein YckC
MKKIEIITTQNVPIQYESADLKDRVIATILDMVFLGFILGIFSLVYLSVFFKGFENDSPPIIIFYVIITLVSLFYSLVQDVFYGGQTWGKKILGIKIIKLNGEVPNLSDYVMRWIFRPIDIWSSWGAIGALLISSGDKSQRIGDILANTTVIKITGFRRISLGDIENLPNAENTEIKYPLVSKFSDEDMLAIKQLLERIRLHKTKTNIDLYYKTLDEIALKLEIEEAPYDGQKFLKDIVNDYVAMTR